MQAADVDRPLHDQTWGRCREALIADKGEQVGCMRAIIYRALKDRHEVGNGLKSVEGLHFAVKVQVSSRAASELGIAHVGLGDGH